MVALKAAAHDLPRRLDNKAELQGLMGDSTDEARLVRQPSAKDEGDVLLKETVSSAANLFADTVCIPFRVGIGDIFIRNVPAPFGHRRSELPVNSCARCSSPIRRRNIISADGRFALKLEALVRAPEYIDRLQQFGHVGILRINRHDLIAAANDTFTPSDSA